VRHDPPAGALRAVTGSRWPPAHPAHDRGGGGLQPGRSRHRRRRRAVVAV